MEKKKGRGPDRNPGTRKERSDAGIKRKIDSVIVRVPKDKNLLRIIWELIKSFKHEANKKTD